MLVNQRVATCVLDAIDLRSGRWMQEDLWWSESPSPFHSLDANEFDITWWLWASKVYVLEYHAIFNLKICQPRSWTTFPPSFLYGGSPRYYWDPKLDGDHGDCCIRQVQKSRGSYTPTILGQLRSYTDLDFWPSLTGRTPWTCFFLFGRKNYGFSKMDYLVSHPWALQWIPISRWMLSSCMATSTWEPWRKMGRICSTWDMVPFLVAFFLKTWLPVDLQGQFEDDWNIISYDMSYHNYHIEMMMIDMMIEICDISYHQRPVAQVPCPGWSSRRWRIAVGWPSPETGRLTSGWDPP